MPNNKGDVMNNTLGGKAFIDIFGRFIVLIAGPMAMVALFQMVILLMGVVPVVVDERMLSTQYGRMGGMILFVATNIAAISGAFFLVSTASIIGGIGLLKRREWGRKVLIVLLWLGLSWSIVATVSTPIVISHLWDMGGEQKGVLIIGMSIVAIGTGVTGSLVCGWLLRRLKSEDVKSECEGTGRDVITHVA